MQFSYDPRYNIAYIRFHDQQAEVESIKVSDELVVDMTPNGKIFGIELLNATEQPAGEKANVLEIINEATGQRVEFPLTL